jgi:hypothetical protein
MDTNLVSQIAQAVTAASPEGNLLHTAMQLGPLGLYGVLFWLHSRTKRLEESLGRIENHLGTVQFKRRP